MNSISPLSTPVVPEGPSLPTPSARGDRGDHVIEAQNLLLRAGESLQRYGADGQFGRETSERLTHFQQTHDLPVTGAFDVATLKALAATPPPKPDYEALFKDGVLRGVMAVGYDETGANVNEQQEVLEGLAKRGYRLISPEERRALDLDPDGHFVTRTFTREGQPARAVLELINPDTPHAKDRFAQALRQQELVLYGGHGRYGSGPDFDDIHSPAGNFVIGQPFEPGHVTLGANDLDAQRLTPGYQLMFFDGCNTFRYFDDLRARTGKGDATLDVIGTTTELYWNATSENLLAALDAVTHGDDLEALGYALDLINSKGPLEHAFRGDGFVDNPR